MLNAQSIAKDHIRAVPFSIAPRAFSDDDDDDDDDDYDDDSDDNDDGADDDDGDDDDDSADAELYGVPKSHAEATCPKALKTKKDSLQMNTNYIERTK